MTEELKELDMFTGTEQYHNIDFMRRIKGTDGIAYVMEKGYSWVVTDALIILNMKLRDQEFVVIELEIKDKTADIIYSDGNGNQLYKQHYKYTDAKTNFKMYYTNDVLMLASEY